MFLETNVFYFCIAAIAIYSFPLSLKEGTSWIVEDQPLTESVVRSFVWAQWEPHHNHLYYLHYRPPPEAGLTLGASKSLPFHYQFKMIIRKAFKI